jgi:hypothetical protein
VATNLQQPSFNMNAKADDFKSEEYTRYRYRVELKDIEDKADIPR